MIQKFVCDLCKNNERCILLVIDDDPICTPIHCPFDVTNAVEFKYRGTYEDEE